MTRACDSYLRPVVQIGPGRSAQALALAGGWAWFDHIEVLRRDAPPQVRPVQEFTQAELAPLTAPRGDIAGLSMDLPRVMGIVNATPDSFSDGGLHGSGAGAVAAGLAMVQSGVDILDIGGESTRPGADLVPDAEETARVVPVIEGLRGAGRLISIDTRKSAVAQAAVAAGAGLINDVSGFTYDPALAPLAAGAGMPVCVMHALGDPTTMQDNPQYGDVLLDVYDFLEIQIAKLERLGIERSQIIADPGIGFGKTQAHNLALLQRISLFHGLGVSVLLGASRKKFIGTIGGASQPRDRAPGSIAVALAAMAQGVQIVRVHDVAETIQAAALLRASTGI
ncbi:MAG: dihydropteroate synthase [Sulfitobacter sp.]